MSSIQQPAEVVPSMSSSLLSRPRDRWVADRVTSVPRDDRSGLLGCLQRFVRGENAAGQRRRLRPQVEGLEHLELLSAGAGLGNMMSTPSPVVEIDAKRSPHVAKLATWNYLAAALEARLAHVLQCIN